jgi:hypothetical protein
MDAKSSFIQRYGRWALITGASDGIGRALAAELAARGLDLFLCARRGDLLDALALELSGRYGVQCRALVADLSTDEGISAVLAATAEAEVGLLAACAGFGTSGAFLTAPIEREKDMLEVNCGAVLALTRVFAGRMAERGRGGIVLMSSIVAYQGVPGAATYAATKAYVQSLAEGIAPELARHGVDVLSVAPGPVESGFAARADMRMGGAERPDVVARGIIAALGRKTTVWPGVRSRLLLGSLSTLPRGLRTAIMSRIMAGMTGHHGRQP